MATQDGETSRDQAGRRRRRHLASPEEREARDAEARRLRVAGLSYREIAEELGCGRGTVERAVRNAPPPNSIIRGERIDGRPVVTIDGQPRRASDPFSFDLQPRSDFDVWYVDPPTTRSTAYVGGVENVEAQIGIWVSREAGEGADGAAVALAGDLAP